MNVRERLIAVARHLGPLNSQVVYVGGSVVHFLIPLPMRSGLRPTEDVDLIVPVKRYYEIQSFSESLRQVGFVEAPEDGVICRWKVEGIVVDVMPLGEAAFGFTNSWYDLVVQYAIEQEVEPGLTLPFPQSAHLFGHQAGGLLQSGRRRLLGQFRLRGHCCRLGLLC